MTFCLFAKVKFSQLQPESAALSYLDFLSVNMINSHISAIRAMSVIFDLQYGSWVHPKNIYFVKSLKLHRPMALPKRNIIDMTTLSS